MWPYFLLTYLAALVNASRYFRDVKFIGAAASAFAVCVYITYCLVYVLAAFIPLVLLYHLLRWKRLGWLLGRSGRTALIVVLPLAVLLTSFVQVYIFADGFVSHWRHFHLNSYDWNLITTPGGLESMDQSPSAKATWALIISGLVVMQAGLLAVCWWRPRVRAFASRLGRKRVIIPALAAAVLLLVAQGMAYAVSFHVGYSPVLAAADAFPFYQPVTSRSLCNRLGLKYDPSFAMKAGSIRVHYPLKALDVVPPAKPLNIVWLVAESWRRDMLDPAIMPRTSEFANQAISFHRHYSSGNGTRMGMFGMFYGLYGAYWFDFLNEGRSPVLMDVLQQQGYDLSMYTSAAFSYPEFDRTIFVRIPTDRMHALSDGAQGYQRDRQNVGDMLQWLSNRKGAGPFMTFMFFESPHARYNFPPECAIRKPYLEDLNYATMDVDRDMPMIKNRYVNSCNHLDTQFARIIDYLRDNKLLDSTIVVITGDHGEEFMEKGYWGHGSGYAEEEELVPLVLWIPGQAHADITRMTNHNDLPATILPLLGVRNDPADYSLGFDLLGPVQREYCVISDWNNMAYVDETHKAIFRLHSIARPRLTTRDDADVNDSTYFDTHRPRLTKIMRELSIFSR